jgi:hypothetical protein
MTKNNTKNDYLDEDIVLLMLKVLDHPLGAKSEFTFSELKNVKYKKIGNKEILDWIIDFTNDNKILPTDFQFEGRNEWEDYEGNKFDMLLSYMDERPQLLDQIRQLLNFKIKIGKSAKNKLANTLKKYIEFFINGKLDYRDGKRYLSFARHKEKFMQIIKDYLERAGKALIINDADFGTEYRFIDCILALETQNYFSAESIRFNENCYEATILPKAKLFQELHEGVQKLKIGSDQLRTIKVPPGTTWESITIKFLNEQEVNIQIKKGRNQKFGFQDFDCVDMRTGKPDKQWLFLIILLESNGVFDPQKCTNIKDREKFRQIKMNLSRRLEKFFSIDVSPFENVDKKGRCRAKFAVQTISILRDDGELRDKSGNKFSDWNTVYNDQAVEM